ncbi:MAG: hypothetical protein ACXWUL_04515 [Caldimonas sp.]
MPTTREPRPARRRALRLAVIVLTLAAGAALVARVGWQAAEARRERAHSVEASALFAERCRAADAARPGIDAVRGADAVVWLPRPLRLSGGRASDRVRPDDAFDRGCSFDECIAGLLRVSFGAASDPDEAAARAEGFRMVEALDPRDLGRYRYQAGIGVVRWLTAAEIDLASAATGEQPGPAVYGLVVQREEIDAFSAPYGIAWDDISNDADRAHGIAGSALTVLDLRTGDVIGRRIGYTIGAAQDERAARGASAARPGTVKSCPQPPGSRRPGTADRDFALSLLR